MKRTVLIVGLVAVVTGCTTTHRMNMTDLNNFKPDCARKDEQLRWLQSQLPSQNDYFMDSMVMTSPTGILVATVDGTVTERKNVADRRYQAVIWAHADYLKRYCAPKPQPVGCVTVREDLPAGSAVGTQCYSSRDPKPVINRWEPMVDR